MLAVALAVASCLSPGALLDANRAATNSGAVPAGTLTTSYSYSGQGLTGEVREVVDLASGAFVESFVIGPTREAQGYDGRLAWMKDTSGFYLPEQGGDKPALAVSQAYLNANAWWRTDRGGAVLESISCDGVRVVPAGGEPFEAWFDPVSHLLIRTRETESYGEVVEKRYSDFAPRGGEQVATRIDIGTNDDPSEIETLRLEGYEIGPTRPTGIYAIPAVEPRDWSLPGGRVTVPFRLLNNHIIVDARVNGRGPFPFLVDTGGHGIVTPSTASALDLREQGESEATGAGEHVATSGYAQVESIQVGNALLFHQTVTELDFSPVDVEGLALGGMIGVEFFERFVIKIDYGARTLTLIDPANFSALDRVRAGRATHFNFYSHMPEVVGDLDGYRGLFNIDTGSRVELTLTSPFVDQYGLRKAYADGITITDGWGVGGPSKSYVVRAGTFELGHTAVDCPVVGLSSAHHGAFSDASYQGNVGSGLLKRFVVTFDYGAQTLYLKRAHYQDPDIGAFDRIGLWLNRAEGGLKIMDIAAGGPAEEAGLKVGDVVTAIGGISVSAETLSDARRSLKLLAVGRPVTIVAERDGKTQSRTVIPRNLIPPCRERRLEGTLQKR